MAGLAVKAKDIGMDVEAPTATCEDEKCPFHGHLKVRGEVFGGTVVSDRMNRTVVVQREYLRRLPKFERLEKRTSRYKAHNPPCIAARQGDQVTFVECRPLSKTVSFVVVERRGGGL